VLGVAVPLAVAAGLHTLGVAVAAVGAAGPLVGDLVDAVGHPASASPAVAAGAGAPAPASG
jgi:hypothetical protein